MTNVNTEPVRFLILGAGAYQVPLIEKALAHGHRVSVASWSDRDPGMALAHDAWVVDTTDKDTLLKMARERGIQAVATTGTDVAVPSIGWLCDHLGLPGLSYATALRCADKIRMQEAFRAHGVRTAPFVPVSTWREAQRTAETMGYPVIVKAPDSSGSRGVVAAPTPAELPAAFEQAMRVSRQDRVLIEKLLVGREFGGQILVRKGEVVCSVFHNDTVTPPPVSVPIGHSCPCNLAPERQREAEALCAEAVKALGIRDAVCNADLILTADGVHVLEMGARAGATGIPEIIRLHTGMDLYEVALALATGQEPALCHEPGAAAAGLVLRAPETGCLTTCRVPPAVREAEGIRDVRFDYPEGAEVRRFRVGPDRIGHVLATADTWQAAERLCAWAAEHLDMVVRTTETRDAC